LKDLQQMAIQSTVHGYTNASNPNSAIRRILN
jgi:hypothetical protein